MCISSLKSKITKMLVMVWGDAQWAVSAMLAWRPDFGSPKST